jgi:cob(I)alamin adenosyltransferase
MGKRLTKIYTRTGDDGTTGLGNGNRIPKESVRIEAIGTVDELNSHLGVLLAENLEKVSLVTVQVARLEKELDEYNATLEALKEFILPAGARAAALCHTARAVCRRAERCVVALYHSETVIPVHIHYLNRLSDFLFVLSRIINRQQGVKELPWEPAKNRDRAI